MNLRQFRLGLGSPPGWTGVLIVLTHRLAYTQKHRHFDAPVTLAVEIYRPGVKVKSQGRKKREHGRVGSKGGAPCSLPIRGSFELIAFELWQ